MSLSSFTITNDTPYTMLILHEPESTPWELPVGEEIKIVTDACQESIHIRTSLHNGKVCLAIWPHKGFYEVIHNGENVF